MDIESLNSMRNGVYNLIKSFFWEPPKEEDIKAWRAFVANLNEDSINREFDKTVSFMKEALDNSDLESIKNEYYELFENPFGEGLSNLNASFLLEGKNFGEPLVEIRDFLEDLKVVKDTDYKDTEDSVLFMIDLMLYLIDSGDCADVQQNFLKKFLYPSFERLAEILKTNEKAYFYATAGLFSRDYLEMDMKFLEGIKSLT
ncbi:TorD/DmsD family molecular chaperone [Flexistipes sp.]|uniref:TorD/DmsD family molecular chaperone n=1 Tax=Flexistipes sp. TaxID=3088135 RepID=UPI002E248595|nr:molecular chaperone TorD family protein [Flexistipes sp.]